MPKCASIRVIELVGGIDPGRPGKPLRLEPSGGGTDRNPVGVSQQLRRSSGTPAFTRNRSASSGLGFLDRMCDQPPADAAWPARPTISEKRVRASDRIGDAARFDVGAAAAFGAHQAALAPVRRVARRTVCRLTPNRCAMSISPGKRLPGSKFPSAIACSSSSAMRRHSETPAAEPPHRASLSC